MSLSMYERLTVSIYYQVSRFGLENKRLWLFRSCRILFCCCMNENHLLKILTLHKLMLKMLEKYQRTWFLCMLLNPSSESDSHLTNCTPTMEMFFEMPYMFHCSRLKHIYFFGLIMSSTLSIFHLIGVLLLTRFSVSFLASDLKVNIVSRHMPMFVYAYNSC